MAEYTENKEQEIDELKKKKREQEKKEDGKILKVVTSSNNTFEKEYNFSEMGAEPFKVKLKVPSMAMMTKVDAQIERQFEGFASFMDRRRLLGFRMYFIIQFQLRKYEDKPGTIEVPDYFQQDLDDIYNIDPLITIGKDFYKFLDTFQH